MDDERNYRCIPLLRKQNEFSDEITWNKIRDAVIHFECEERELKNYLISDAISDWEADITKTFLLFWHNKLVGYFSLTIDNLIIVNEKDTETVTALRISHIARDSKFKGCMIGNQLMSFVYVIAYLISKGKLTDYFPPTDNMEYLMVEAKKGAIPYYLRNSFKITDTVSDITKNICMYMPLTIMFMEMDKYYNEQHLDIFEKHPDNTIFTTKNYKRKDCKLSVNPIPLDEKLPEE